MYDFIFECLLDVTGSVPQCISDLRLCARATKTFVHTNNVDNIDDLEPRNASLKVGISSVLIIYGYMTIKALDTSNQEYTIYDYFL